MNWLVDVEDNTPSVCTRSACFTFDECICRGECAKNTGFCLVKFNGPDCTKRSCAIYMS